MQHVMVRTTFGLVILLLAGCRGGAEVVEVTVHGETLTLEVADSPEMRATGLMHRESISPRHGMLFVFESSEVRRFWMKNTLIPLSIAYLDEAGEVVRIADMQPQSIDPVSSLRPARYAIEVNRGEFAEIGLSVGDRIELPSAVRR